MSRRRAALLFAVAALATTPAFAQQVLSGDPVDTGGTGLAYPIMPGVKLVLPGDDEKFGTGDDVINSLLVGDVDLVVRSGTISSPAIPAPALNASGPAIATVTAGGGRSGQGAEADFTVMVSDGSGSPPYGNVVPNTDMDLRPVTVYAFADLDGDGTVGPTNTDGSGDNGLETQEATAYAGRQMGAFLDGVFQDSLGLHLAAPASIGGLRVGLVAGAWTGADDQTLYTDGPFILTRWPFFPPLDPKDLLGGGDAPDPDPALPNQLEWDIETNYLPSPNHPVLGTPFAVAVDGSEPTTDQVRVNSGAAVSARVFTDASVSDFLARSSTRLRVAPPSAGSGRVLVMPVERAALAADGTTSRLSLRVLPVDLFANVADPSSAVSVTLTVTGSASIASPDTDAQADTETILLSDAAGVDIELDDDGTGSATLVLAIGDAPVQSVPIAIGATSDSDGDSVVDDGSASQIVGDWPCDEATASCDDNCPRVINPSQLDSDHDGLGDCCDGTCEMVPADPACGECALPVDPPPPPSAGSWTGATVTLRPGSPTKEDRLSVRLAFSLAPSAALALDGETVTFDIAQDGHAGYAAVLASLLTDLNKPNPFFRYIDRDGAVDGVTRLQVKCKSDRTCRVQLAARGIGLADLVAGDTTVSMALGDDLFEGSLACTGAPRLRCTLVP